MNIFKYCSTLAKLLYLHMAYFFVGLDQEHFYIARANYFADLRWFCHAIGNYKKALKEYNDPYVLSALGWCYSQLDMLDRALDYYKQAHKKSNQPDVAIGLAYVLYHLGDAEESQNVLQVLSEHSELTETHLNEINKLESLLTQTK